MCMDPQDLLQEAVVSKEERPPPADGGAGARLAFASSSHETQRGLLNRISKELAQLDKEEEEFLRSMNRKRVELNRLWNSALPIHNLPHDLLIRLFADFRDIMEKDRSSRIRMPWRGLMLVCRYWRDIFVSTPAFWRTVNLKRSIDWTKLCLARSVPASIEVATRHGNQCPLDIIYPHAHRFRTFLFEAAYDSQFESGLSNLFDDGMPLLEDLTFSVFEKPPAAEPVDANLTSQQFPFLHALTLRATVAPRDVSLYAQLRELSLTLCSHNLSFEGFLDALSACMQLEQLTLWNTLPRPSGEEAHGEPVTRRSLIILPRLREFALVEPGILQTSRFLANFLLHPSVALEINTSSYQVDTADDILDVKGITGMLPPDRSTTLPILAIATHVEMTISYDQYEIKCSGGPLDPQTGSPISTLSADDDSESPTWNMGLRDLIECFGRAPLTCLKVSTLRSHAAVDAWERVFRTFPLLEELHIDGEYEFSRVFLGLHAASSKRRECSSVACPNLRQVSVVGLGAMEAYEAMRECFQFRADRGARLQILDFTDLSLDGWKMRSEQRRGFVEDLRRVVEYVRAR